MTTSAERDWSKWQTVAVKLEKAWASSLCYTWFLPISMSTQCFVAVHGCWLAEHLIPIRSYSTSHINISGPTRTALILKSLPRYTFLQNIYSCKVLFCIFWDIKNCYIKEVIYCSLTMLYSKMLWAHIIWDVLHASERVFVNYINRRNMLQSSSAVNVTAICIFHIW